MFEELDLKEIIEFKNGKKRPKDEGQVPVYGGNGVLSFTNESNYSDCIIVGRVGAYCGSVFYSNEDCWVSDNAIAAIPKKGTDTLFAYYLLKNLNLNNHRIGSSQPLLTQGILNGIRCHVPNEEAQKKISSVLSTIDNKINNNEAINRNLSNQAAAIFEEWTSSCEEEISIGELADNIIDYNVGNYEKVVLINSSDVTAGHFDHHDLSENKDLKGHFKKAFKKGDILYSEIRPRNRHYAYCQFEPEGYIASTRLMIIRNKPDMISSAMLYQYLMLRDVFEEFTLKTESRSGTFPQGRYEDMAAIKVPYTRKDKREIAEIMDALYALIWKNDIEIRRLTELRDSLLPKLMSGELDVSVLDI